MTKAEQLTKLLTDVVIPDIEDFMDELFVLIADKRATDDDKADLDEMRELREEFKEMLIELENGDIDEDECDEIIEEINEMREGEED